MEIIDEIGQKGKGDTSVESVGYSSNVMAPTIAMTDLRSGAEGNGPQSKQMPAAVQHLSRAPAHQR